MRNWEGGRVRRLKIEPREVGGQKTEDGKKKDECPTSNIERRMKNKRTRERRSPGENAPHFNKRYRKV
ncbi:MAG: hypothetical protein JRI26_06690 [Deltaproteobacteria bacterium]|nr:hypothetical protein [Deltaproteobacteria bacterium]